MTIRFTRIVPILMASACALHTSADAYAATADSPPSLSDSRWEELVVVGHHLPRPAREVGSALTVLTDEVITQRRQNLASELLRQVPGLAVNRSGQVGANTQVRIRGAEGNHTLVLIDGIEANDPFVGEFNFADLLSWDLGRIEVLRGPQSALYGSDAIGGVISISSIDPAPGLNAHAELEAGSFGTRQLGTSLHGAGERVSALLSASRYDTDGISASALAGEDEADGYRNTTVHGKLDAAVTEGLDLRLVLRHADNDVEGDAQPGGVVVDADDETESEQWFGLVALTGRLLDDRWRHRLAYGYTESHADNFSSGALISGSRGERRKVEYDTSLRFGSDRWAQSVTAGIEHEALRFQYRSPGFPAASQRREDDQISYVGEYALTWDGSTSASLSVRYDDNDRFEDATTVRLTGSHLFERSGTRIHASYGEGITNPTFFELFGFIPSSFIGNAALEPERTESWDVGVEQALLNGRALVDLSYFEATLDDEIATVFTPSFEATVVNLGGQSERAGIELSGSLRLGAAVSVDASYSYLDAEEPSGAEEVRRPRHAGSINVNYSFLDGRGNANLGAVFNGEQEDAEFIAATPRTRVTLDAYTLLNAVVSVDVSERVELFVRGENLLDQDYQQVFGFRSPGIAGYLGVRARL